MLDAEGWKWVEVLRRDDMAASGADGNAEGQGADPVQPEDIVLPAFLAADLPGNVPSMMTAE